MRRRIYTEQMVDVIVRMVVDGATNRDIAHVVGTTEHRLQTRMSQLGIRRDSIKRHGTVDIKVPIRIVAAYCAAATSRALSDRRLIELVLARVAEDNLFTAILDDGK